MSVTVIRKAKITQEHLDEARRLREIWDSKPHETQAEFGEKYGIGNQSSVGQFLHGRVPLSLKAATGFAMGLRCEIADFSPRIDRMAKSLMDGLDSSKRYLQEKNAEEDRVTGRQYEFYSVPVVGRDASGNLPEKVWTNSSHPDQATGEFVQLGQSTPFTFAVEVQGISMVPRYQPGEYMIVEPSVEANIEDDVLVRLQTGRVLLRRLASDAGANQIQLTSYNDTSVLSVDHTAITWLYHVAHPVPRRKVSRR